MDLKIKPLGDKLWLWIYSCGIFALLMFYMLYPVNFYLGETLYKALFAPAVLLLAAFYYLKRGLRDGLEIKLLTAYCIWFLISRLLNGDAWLQKEKLAILESLAICLCLPLMLNLSAKSRRVFMDIFSLIACSLITVLSAFGIYSAIYRKYLVNPITGASLSNYSKNLTFLDFNPNVCAAWIFLCFWLLVYLIAKSRRKSVRIPLLLACLVNFAAMALTHCRNIQVAMALGFGLLAVLFVLTYLNKKPALHRALCCVLLFCLVFLAAYKSYDLATMSVGELSQAVSEPAEGSAADGSGKTYVETKGLADTGRISIYKSVITDLVQEPSRLLKGTICADVMESANKRLPKDFGHAHCTYLELLARTGIPGFLLIAAFCALTLLRAVKLLFSAAPLAVRLLVIPTLGFFWYNLLESSWLILADFRSASFMLLAGFVLAHSYDLSNRGTCDNETSFE